MNFQQFKSEAKKILDQHAKAFKDFSWEQRAVYADWCAQTYYYVCHSTRLLALAAARLDLNEERLHVRMIEHLGEEKNHQKLAAADVKNLGFDMKNFSELAETRAFYQGQYYLIEHANPKALLGYILSLEAVAADEAPAAVQRIAAAHGPKSYSFWKLHGEEDVDHVEKLYGQLAELNSGELEIVLASLEQSCRNYQNMMVAIEMRQGQTRKMAA